MAAQTAYTEEMAIGFPGMLADSGFTDKLSKHNAEASAEIPFGVVVATGTAEDAAILPVDANSKLLGVVVHSHAYGPDQIGTTGVKPKQILSVLNRGRIIVQVEEAVAVGDRAFVRHTSGAGGTQKGAFRKSADTATAVELKGAVYRRAAGAGGLAVVEVDFNVVRATQA